MMRADTVTKPKVVVAESISEAGLDTLREHCEVDVAAGVERSELLERVRGANALVVRSATKVDAELIEAAATLEVIGRAGIGVDNIDLDAATKAGVLVVNAPNANTISAAEHTMALLLAQARRISEADGSLRGGSWERNRFQGVELHGKVLGIIGLGRIGTLVAQRASAFGMRVVAHDPYVSDDRARRIGVDMVSLDELYEGADFISIHLPLTRTTVNLIGAEALARMKPGVRLVNVARGGIVDEHALADAIRSGHVAGAAVDVFAEEPAKSSPLFELPEVVVTPHLGASTREAQDKAGTAVAQAVADALRGELVLSAVNVDLGPQVADDVRPYLPLTEQLARIFVVYAQGVPSQLTVSARGKLAGTPIRPLALAALKGLLSSVSDVTVSYVNAPLLAEARGVKVIEEAIPEGEGYESTVELSGTVNGTMYTIMGSNLERKGLVLVGVGQYEIELPLSDRMLLVRNDDVPGVIGRVGTYLGDRGINISNMAVGRSPDGRAAMMGMNLMGISLDQPLNEAAVEGLRWLDGVDAVRFIDLT